LQAHGANFGAHCGKCGKDCDRAKLDNCIKEGKIMNCDKCDGPVKPKIVFFGEGLPHEFMKTMMQLQLDAPDLVIVIGTALAVAPVNMIVTQVDKSIPKVLINLTDNKEHGFPFDDKKGFPERFWYEGKCDEVVREIVEACGW
jgi:NAD-dependent histone deacetylase SIR2